jgi:calcium-dependent protein kinase
MLAGHPPFHADKRYRNNIVRGKYYPLKGVNWENISDTAKDLVAKVLDRNPDTRFGVEDILNHAWLQDVKCAEGNVSFGEAYSHRLKHLVLRSKLKRCFAETSITNNHQCKKESFQSELSFLDTPAAVMQSESVSLQEYFVLSNEYNGKLLKLKELLVHTILDKNGGDASSEGDQRLSKRRRINLVDVEFGQFCALMESVGLGTLARPEIFSIFDEDNDGSINAKEFLLALMALRTADTDIHREEEAAQLYFSLFDVDEDGMISKEEMVSARQEEWSGDDKTR